MKNAGFSLDHYFVPEITVKANQTYSSECKETPTEGKCVVYMHRRESEGFAMVLSYSLGVNSDSDPYSIDVVVAGTFSADGDLSDEELSKRVAISGPNILYGVLRAHIAIATGSGPFPQIFLPPVVFGPEDFFVPDVE